MSAANKALVRTLFEGADRNDVTVLDEVVHEDYVDHNPPPFASATPGLIGAHETFATATKIFSDWSHEIVQQFSDGDYVITQIVGRGRHTGELMGIPATDNAVEMPGIAIHRIVDGKVVEHWSTVDGLAMLMQIGAVPMPGG